MSLNAQSIKQLKGEIVGNNREYDIVLTSPGGREAWRYGGNNLMDATRSYYHYLKLVGGTCNHLSGMMPRIVSKETGQKVEPIF